MASDEQTNSREMPAIEENDEALYVYKNYNQQKLAARQQCKAPVVTQSWLKDKEDIVISGMSGRFPESDTVDEFAHNLYNNIDMVVEDERRWPFGFLGLPRGSGKIKDISRFDYRFFNIDEHEANFMDSQLRIMLEITFEALWDAGIDPASLAGTNTGVYLGNCFDEYMTAYAEDYTRLPNYRNCFFGLLSKVYNFKGPSKPFDTACASGFSALHEAVVALRSSQCDRIVVVGLNLCLRAVTQNQFLNLNMISPDGHCKCLDDDANGYAKGEACVAIVLQKKSEAKRIYATVVHTKTNCDGYKDLGITYPSFELQRELIQDAYNEAGLDPLEVGFCEAHCTGTQAGDPSEMRAIYESMCCGRTIDKPLLIGAIKSVIGHAEASSGLCSLVKSVLCFQRELIPANLHMNKINHRIDGLVNGILKPVTVNTTYHGKYIGLNCFGFGGVNVHAIIRKHDKENAETVAENLPRLVTFCGRNQKTLNAIYNFLSKNPNEITPDFLALLNDVSKTSPYRNGMFKGMRHRGYVLVEMNKSVSELKSLKIEDSSQPPVCFVFTGMGCQWTGMGQGLTEYPTISSTLEKCSTVLRQIDAHFDLVRLLNSEDPAIFKSPINSFVGIAAIQVCLVDLLEELGVRPDYIVGHSIGELACAYADKCLTLDETIAAAYWRGRCIEDLQNSQNRPGAMAAIGCSWEDATDLCKQLAGAQIWPACHNGQNSVTVSGYKDDVDSFVNRMQQNMPDIFVRSVNSSEVAFHSPLVKDIQTKLLGHLSELLGNRTQIKTSKWISTTYAEDNDKFTPTYLVDNLIRPVTFFDAFAKIPTDAIYVEIGPHHLLQSIIKQNILSVEGCRTVKYVPSLSRQNANFATSNVKSVLEMMGMLYSNGLNPRTELLYPKVGYPVARSTASLHSFIQWKHDRKFTVTQYPDFFNQTKLHDLAKIIDLQHKDDQYIQDHCIDGRILFPATGYLYLAWTYVAKIFDVDHLKFPIMFENVNLHRATIMPKSGVTNFRIRFIKGTGSFAISESETVVVTGKITIPNKRDNFLQHQQLLNEIDCLETKECQLQMKNKDIYKEFRLRGYDYGPKFQSIEQIKQINKTIIAKVTFKNWVSFVDSMIQLAVIGNTIRGLYLPVRLNMLRCDPVAFQAATRVEGSQDTKVVNVLYDGLVNIGVAQGIEFQGIKANLAPRKSNIQIPVEETFEFVAHNELEIPYTKSRALSPEATKAQTDQLKMYQENCARIAISCNNNNKEIDINNLMHEIKHYEQMSQPVLFQILNQHKANNFQTNEMARQFENLEEDLLFRTYLNERFLRSQLETVCENILQPTVQVLEVNQTPNIMVKTILDWLSLSSFKMTFNYRLLHSALENVNSNKVELTSSQHDWIVEKSKFPSDLINLDLIVYKDSSLCPLLPGICKPNINTLLESMCNALTDNRFALIILRDKLFPVEQNLFLLFGKNSDNYSRVEELTVALKNTSFQIISRKSDQLGVNVLLIRKMSYKLVLEEQIFMPITNDVKQWFVDVQNRLRECQNNNSPGRKYIWLMANQSISGVIGLVSCLRKEPMGAQVRCILSIDCDKFPLDTSSEIIRKIVDLNLYTNVVDQNGSIGSFKHFTLPSEDKETKLLEHCFLNVTTRGDLSSLCWFEAQHKFWPKNRKNNQILCTVYYSALNFRDIMLATGKLPPDALPDNMGLDDCLLGFEFSGRDENGNRVMGIISSKGLATTVVMESRKFLWPIPTEWTMEEASTVPVVYATAYYALIIRGKLQPNEKVLIHSGSGAVGQAAISICLHYNCQIFITVGSDEKRDILMKLFPTLKPHQFASSRNTDFENVILQTTKGQGVDVVLNSLAEEKLQASVNCLAPNGRFLEIGKFDLSQNNRINIAKIMQNKTFHGILLDNLFNFGPNVPSKVEKHRDQIWELLKDGIKHGVVRPLKRQIFPVDKCEEAFRFMASGKHTGKVVICIRPEEIANKQGIVEIDSSLRLNATPRTVFQSNKSYIVTGGLGGFGLELINWMIEREARKIIITSRTGIKDLYQKTRIDYFEKCGATIKIVTKDVSTQSGAQQLINEAQALGMVGGVFHLAMVLSDGLFDNQTLDSFETATKPKADAFLHLDRITRRDCPEIDYFVVFSSVSCGVGNPGQSNYGFANSVMERGCEQRRRDGLHGFAIQWGAIGDVGYIIDNIRGNEVVICGSIPQRIPSCLASLDRLLQSPYAVCSNLIRADLKLDGPSSKASLIKTIAHILGLKEYNNLELNVNLGELGMDSLMGVEVKQAIERDYDVVLSMQDVRKLTIGKILEIGTRVMKTCNDSQNKSADENCESMDDILVPQKSFCYLNDIVNGSPVIFIPQIDGNFDLITPIAKKLNRPAIGINWTKECLNLTTVSSVASYYNDIIETIFSNSNLNYDLIGYSFGGIVAIEMVLQLQKRKTAKSARNVDKLILLDSSPKQFKIFTDVALKNCNIQDKYADEAFVESILMFLMDKLAIDYGKIKEILMSIENATKRIEFVQNLYKQMKNIDLKNETLEFLINSHYNKMLMLNQYDYPMNSFDGDLMLIRASEYLVNDKVLIKEDYWLSEIVTGRCELHILKGDHKTFITENYNQLIELIQGYLLK